MGAIAGTVEVAKLAVGSHVDGVSDVVVFLDAAPGLAAAAPKTGPTQVAQHKLAFQPRVQVVPVGTAVAFPNQDAVRHNVFSVSPAQPFDLGLAGPGPGKTVTMTHPGVVAVHCNIHPQMVAWLVVTANAFVTRPDKGGHFSLTDVPPGTYHLIAWFPHGEAVEKDVTVTADRPARVGVRLREGRAPTRHLDKQGKPYARY